MKKGIFIIINIIYIINYEITYDSFSIDDFINKINDVPYKKSDYDLIIKSISNILYEHYAYVDIAKQPPNNIGKVDLIKELNEIKTNNTKYFDFYNEVQNIIYKARDMHLNVIFKKISQYQIMLPIKLSYKKLNKNEGLYIDIPSNNFLSYFDKNIINQLKLNKNSRIRTINGNNNIYDFLLNYPFTSLKDEHAQFSLNLNTFTGGNITFPLNSSRFKNLIIEFENNNKVTIDYKIFLVKKISKKFQSYYLKELEKYNDNIFQPSILDIYQKYEEQIKLENNLKKNNLNWTSFYKKIKYRVDNDNKFNVIVQNSFNFKEENIIEFLGKMMEEFSKNNYPIIVIQDLNGGGLIYYSSLLQKVLNYNSAKKRIIVSSKVNEKNINLINKKHAFNIENCNYEKLYSDKKSYKENFQNKIEYTRTQFYLLFDTYNAIEEPLKEYKHIDRKPTEIIVFTDGFSFSTTSFFIKDLQESGNAIIVGYNGIPSEERKKEKFNGSQSPSSVLSLEETDPNAKNLLKYNITMRATFYSSYNESYQNNSIFHIPREYLINPIDERSNIFGKYDDSRYNEFINESKIIFEKYKSKCNKDNKNLLLKSDSCNKFINDEYARGGFECGDDGNWSNICKPYYCTKGYYFDTYYKKCKKDVCYYSYYYRNLIIIILVVIIGIIILSIGILLCCRYCNYCSKNDDDNNFFIGPLITSND